MTSSTTPAATSSDPSFGVLLTLAYEGSSFSGWALQTNARTIAGELLRAVRTIDPLCSEMRGASRTDAGVHALAQRVTFATSKSIAPRGWVLALTRELPREIAVVRAAAVGADHDPRRLATRKTYRYSVLESPVHDPFLHRRAWRVHQRLNQSRMHAALDTLLGEHDFRAFRSAADSRANTVRNILRAELSADPRDPRLLCVEVEGDRFMHHMVRIICGSLVDIGRGRLPVDALKRALGSGSRRDLGMTAPAAGLCLTRVELRDEGRDPWPAEVHPLVDSPPPA